MITRPRSTQSELNLFPPHRGQAPARSGSGPTLGQDDLLAIYFGDLGGTELMSREEEIAAALHIAERRRQLWNGLLAYPPYGEAICALIREVLPAELRPDVELDAMQRASRSLRDHPLVEHERAHDAARTALGARMTTCDRDGVAAERVVGGVLELGAGRSMRVKSPPRGSRPFARYVAEVQASRDALTAARCRLVEANLRLVVSIAKRNRHGVLALEDLIQEGNLGLMKAADRFDPGRGFRFATYAAWWIAHAIGRAIAQTGATVRLPVYLTVAQRKVERAQQRFAVLRGREPTDAELMEMTGMGALSLEHLRSAPTRAAESLDAIDEGGVALRDRLADTTRWSAPEQLDVEVRRAGLREALSRLSPLELDILHSRFGLDGGPGTTHEEVGQRHALSRQRVGQIQKRALGKLRTVLQRQQLA